MNLERKEIDLSVETTDKHDRHSAAGRKLVVVTPLSVHSAADTTAIVVTTTATRAPAVVVVKLEKEASSREVYYYESDDSDDDVVYLGSNADLPDTQRLKVAMAGAMAGDSEETTLDVDDEVDDDTRGWPPLRPPIRNWAKSLKNKSDFKVEGESTGESGSEEYF